MAVIIAFITLIGRIISLNSESTAESAPSSVPVATAVPTERWKLITDKSEMDDSKTLTLGGEAQNQITGWLTTYRPGLLIRCQEKKTDVFIDTGMAAAPEYGTESFTVRLRIDDKPAIAQLWDESTNHTALFAPSPVTLARQLGKAKKLRFEFTPFNASPQTAEFDLEGLDRHLQEVAQDCGWSAE